MYFLTGLDEHGQKVQQTAEKQGLSPLALCDTIAQAFQGLCQRLGISHNDFIRTTEDRHKTIVQAITQKLFAGFTNSASINGDKQVTLDYLFHLAMQHGGLWVGAGMMPANSKAATRKDVNWMGAFSGAMAQSPSDASAAEMLPGDLETGRLLGQRVAAVAARLGD